LYIDSDFPILDNINMEQPFKKITSGNDINWNHVYYFTKVAAYGSIKEAAKQLEIQS